MQRSAYTAAPSPSPNLVHRPLAARLQVRRYLQHQLSLVERQHSSAAAAAAAAAAAGAAAGKAQAQAHPQAPFVAPEPSAAVAAGLSTYFLSAEATAGGDAGLDLRDPVLAAWLVTRTPPDLPVRGWQPPPGRTACKLVAAKEMQE